MFRCVLRIQIVYILFIFILFLVDDCKKRWRNIKDTYKKRLKKRKGNGSSDLIKSKHWPLADVLTFLGKTDCKRE